MTRTTFFLLMQEKQRSAKQQAATDVFVFEKAIGSKRKKGSAAEDPHSTVAERSKNFSTPKTPKTQFLFIKDVAKQVECTREEVKRMQASCGKDKVSKPHSMDLWMEDMLKGRQGKRAEKEQGNKRIQSEANSALA